LTFYLIRIRIDCWKLKWDSRLLAHLGQVITGSTDVVSAPARKLSFHNQLLILYRERKRKKKVDWAHTHTSNTKKQIQE
jgi:hypothetical protein